MPKYYCDYCDIFLTHDTRSVRKGHKSGWRHKQAVQQYYAALSKDKVQDIIDQITDSYANVDGSGNFDSSTRRSLSTAPPVGGIPHPPPFMPHKPSPIGHDSGKFPFPPLGPDGKPFSLPPLGPDGKPFPFPPLGLDGKPFPFPPLGPDGKPFPFPPLGPDGKPFSLPPLGPDGKPFPFPPIGPNGVPFPFPPLGPDGKPFTVKSRPPQDHP